jgi:hypothetical protein
MVVHDFDVLRPPIGPPKHDPSLIVDSDRMPAHEVSSQSFQSVARRRRKITKHCGVVQLHQFSAGDLGKIRRKSLWNAALLEDPCSECAPEG